MAKYIEIINDSGTVSVDDTQPRLSLIRSVRLNTIGYDNSGNYSWSSEYSWGYDQYRTINWKRFPISLNSNEKMFSVRALQNNPHIGFTRLASGSSLSYLYAYENVYNQIDYSNYVIDFYGYDSTKTGVLGVQVFDPNDNEKLIFNSNKYYFDIKGQYNIQLQDGTASIFADRPDIFPRTINIGGYSRNDSAVVINNGSYSFCKYFSFAYPYDIVYTVVFDSTIRLEPRIAFWVNEWSTFTNESNHLAYPNFSRVSSGVILDTTNIS